MKERFIVYLLKSQKDNSIYVGCTTDIARRLNEHNQGTSQYTREKSPWALKWYCVFYDKMMAYNFERYLKSGSGKAFISKRILPVKNICDNIRNGSHPS